MEVFGILRPDILMLVDTEPKEAAQRLNNRDGANYSITLLESLREKEIAHAMSISQFLRIPLLVLDDDLSKAVDLAKPLLRTHRNPAT